MNTEKDEQKEKNVDEEKHGAEELAAETNDGRRPEEWNSRKERMMRVFLGGKT